MVREGEERKEEEGRGVKGERESRKAKWEESAQGETWKKAAVQSKKGVNTKVGAFDGPAHWVFVYPDRKLFKIKGNAEELVPVDVCLAIIEGTAVASEHLAVCDIPGRGNIFVWAHTARDARCGYCGPVLAKKLHEEIQERKEMISVYKCSHVGGHEFAGNVLVFVDREENKQPVIGDWYGYVNPAAISKILDAVLSGQVLIELWRGTLGLSQEEAESRIKKHDAARAPSCKVECGACDTPAAKCS